MIHIKELTQGEERKRSSMNRSYRENQWNSKLGYRGRRGERERERDWLNIFVPFPAIASASYEHHYTALHFRLQPTECQVSWLL